MTTGARTPLPARARPALAGGAWLFAGLLCLSPAARAVDPEQFPALGRIIQDMVSAHDMQESELRALFAQVNIKPDIIEAMERPKEGLPWYEYRKLFVTDENARLGLRYWRANAQALARAYDEFGVEPEIVVAIIGVETRYGKNTGGYRVLDALTTLALKSADRADYFRGELEEFLLLTRELNVDPLSIKGSYAGAMGVPQFMPSSYRLYAVDFDSDRQRNIIKSADDAIGSVANYFKAHGWRKGEPVTDEAQLDGILFAWLGTSDDKPALSVRELRKYGVVPIAVEDLDQPASVFALEGENGPLFRLGYNNFYVITRYNHSRRYAMAVYELSKMLRKLYDMHP